MQGTEENVKGTNYAARHDAGAFSAPACFVRRTGKTKYEKGESRTGACLQEDAGAFFIRFCAINPISGSKKNGFFNQAVTVLQSLVVAIGAILSIWGGINLLEGYGGDNRATRS